MHFQATQGRGKKQPFDGGGRMQVWPGTLSFDGDCSELTVVFVAQSVFFYNGIFLSCSPIFMSLLHSVSFVHTNLTSSQGFFFFNFWCPPFSHACVSTPLLTAVSNYAGSFFFSLRIHCNRHDYHLPRAKKQGFLKHSSWSITTYINMYAYTIEEVDRTARINGDGTDGSELTKENNFAWCH